MKQPKMEAKLMEITPALATKWLELNTDNRNISDRWVDAIAADIEAGKWDPNNASIGIVVDAEGRPLRVADGQHRLWAVTKAGKSIWTWVVFGDEANLRRENIDRVKPRSVADQLQLLFGVKNARRVAAACSVIRDIEAGTVGHSIMTLEMAREIQARHGHGLDWALTTVYGNQRAGQKYLDRAGVVGSLAYCYPTAPEKVDRFAVQVRDGESITRLDPAYALRTYIDRASDGRGNAGLNRIERHEMVVMTMRALLAAIKGEQLSALKPGAIMGGGFYRDALRFFGRAHSTGVTVRKRNA